ncbi:MAG: Amuc_1099 family pilus-like system protein [Luteolibacter sp.]
MSWFSKNYEKAALGGAVALALGLAYMGFSKFGSVEQDFNADLKGKGVNDPSVKGADLIPKALASGKLDHSWTKADVAGRPVDLFTGIPLFVSSKAPDVPIDPLNKDEPPIHPPIPNIWWIENRLDPGYADSPSRDPDQDGFSNLDEFNAKTDPNNAKSFPALIAKLMYLKDESLAWVLRPGFNADGKFPFNYEDSNRQANKTGVEPVAPNALFFDKGPMKERFKLLGSEVRKEHNTRINMEVEVTIVRIEDQRPNKKGTIYEVPASLQEQRKNEFLHFDRTAVFSLEALGFAGKDFKVEENTSFALPPGSTKKDYKVVKITPESVEVEYPDESGAKKTLSISKGSLPQMPTP